MKKAILKFLPVLTIGLFALGTTSCSSDNEESCNQFDSNVGSCSAEDITACCDDEGSCYYTYNGERYDDAAEIAAVCTAGTTLDMNTVIIEMDAFTQQLVDEARSAAICN